MLISVILPSYNERHNIQGALDALVSQRTEMPYEIIVVDSSEDGTADIVRQNYPSVLLIRSERALSCGEAKNLGLLRAQGKKILFTDADVRVREDWIDRMSRHLDAVDVVCGSFANGTPRSFSGTIGYLLEFFRILPEGRPRLQMNPSFVIGGNSGYRKEVIRDHKFISGIGEDIIFAYEILKSSATGIYDPNLAVTHLNRTGFKKVFAYQVRLGEGAYRYRSILGLRPHLFLKHPALIFLVPPYILLSILVHLLYARYFLTTVIFLFLSPLMLAANYCWAYGYVQAGWAAKAGVR